MFYVIDWSNEDYPSFAMNEDGTTQRFDTAEEAQVVADDCQDGQVIER